MSAPATVSDRLTRPPNPMWTRKCSAHPRPHHDSQCRRASGNPPPPPPPNPVIKREVDTHRRRGRELGLSSILMASHGPSSYTFASLLADKYSLLCSMVSPGGNNTRKALGKYLPLYDGEIPWVRMYEEFPDGHSGLRIQAWNEAWIQASQQYLVFYTPIKRHGATISRKAFRGGTWQGKGANQNCGNEINMTKLYYKHPNRAMEDELTVTEFVLKMDQGKVAVCVLHRKDYRGLIQSLNDAAFAACENPSTRDRTRSTLSTKAITFNQRNSRGANQANQMAVQRPAPMEQNNSAPSPAGFMNGSHNINLDANYETSDGLPSLPSWELTDHLPELAGDNLMFENPEYYAAAGMPNSFYTLPGNGRMHDVTLEHNTMNPEYYDAAGTQMQNLSNTLDSFGRAPDPDSPWKWF